MNKKYDIWIGCATPGPIQLSKVQSLYNKLSSYNYQILTYFYNEINMIMNNQKAEYYYRNLPISVPRLVLLESFELDANTKIILQQFKMENVICLNDGQAISTAHNKLECAKILAKNNIPTPKTCSLQPSSVETNIDIIEKTIGYPCIIKPIEGTLGIDISLCNSRDELSKLLYSSLEKLHEFFAQECVTSSIGTSLRVLVVDDQILGGMKRSNVTGKFISNIFQGGIGEPYQLTQQTKDLCLKINKVLELKISGIDLLFDRNNDFTVCEVNPTTGFAGFEKANGVDVAGIIAEYCHFLLLNQSNQSK
jgi:RimK family alpha-L-glutamate ligase